MAVLNGKSMLDGSMFEGLHEASSLILRTTWRNDPFCLLIMDVYTMDCTIMIRDGVDGGYGPEYLNCPVTDSHGICNSARVR